MFVIADEYLSFVAFAYVTSVFHNPRTSFLFFQVALAAMLSSAVLYNRF